MRVLGIIAEYNPFHNGHKYHLEQAGKLTGAEATVAVISGAVTQRGEKALADKWSRARMAVDNGVDLVLELPFAFACNSAEEFARGGLSILGSLGCVTDVAFGCESDPERLIAAARASAEDNSAYEKLLREAMEEGLSYPAARSRAFLHFYKSLYHSFDPAKTPHALTELNQPNDILGVEYVRRLCLAGSQIQPWGIPRKGSGYHSSTLAGSFASATAIREELRRLSCETACDEGFGAIGDVVPEATVSLLREMHSQGQLWMSGGDGPRMEGMDYLILGQLRRLGPSGLRQVAACGEGLEYRLWNALSRASTVEELLNQASSGRYPTARLRRLLMQSLVGLTAREYQSLRVAADERRLYGRILGFNNQGAQLLRQIKGRGSGDCRFPMLTNLNKELTPWQRRFVKGECTPSDCLVSGDEWLLSLRLDVASADFCRLAVGQSLYAGSDFVRAPYVASRKSARGKNEKSSKSTGFL